MPRFLRLITGAAVALCILIATSGAEAAPGHATAGANIRSGPGTEYGIVDRLDRGDYVIVIRCSTNWCLIHHIGPDGWVSRQLLVNPYYSTGSGKGYEVPPPTYNRRSTR
jgi:uncharacterized protein YraI